MIIIHEPTFFHPVPDVIDLSLTNQLEYWNITSIYAALESSDYAFISFFISGNLQITKRKSVKYGQFYLLSLKHSLFFIKKPLR